MANINTLQGLQDRIHLIFEGDTSTPATTTDDWSIRLTFINDAIHRWEKADATDWNELWTTLTDASTGTKTTTNGTSAYATPTNFVKPGGYVRVTNSNNNEVFYPVLPDPDAQLFDQAADQYAYFTGNPSATYKVNIKPTPTVTGSTINYDYYKQATELSATTDVTECPDPSFIVHHVLSNLYRQQRDMTRATDELSTAEEMLGQMQAQNAMAPAFQDKGLLDRTKLQGRGFGV